MGLKELRKQSGLSQRETSELLGLSQARVSRIESTPIRRISTEALYKYAEAFGATVSVTVTSKDGKVIDLSD